MVKSGVQSHEKKLGLPRRCAPRNDNLLYEIITLPAVARNGHNTQKVLLFSYTPYESSRNKPLLLKDIMFSYSIDKVRFLLSKLMPLNIVAKNRFYVDHLNKITNMTSNTL